MQRSIAVLLLTIPALLLCTAIVVAYGVRVRRRGRAMHPRLGTSPGTALLPGLLVEAFYWALNAPGRRLARWGVPPDLLTYLSLGLSLSSLPLCATGRFAPAAAAVLLGGGLDALDGMVARSQGRACAAGAVLDSFVDRLSDAAPLVGLALFYRARAPALAVPLLALTASSLVSYARAKADIYGLALPNGLMRRHERVAYLVVSLLLGPLVPAVDLGGPIVFPVTLAGVLVIGLLGLAASMVLIARVRAALIAAARRGVVTPAPASPRKEEPVRAASQPMT